MEVGPNPEQIFQGFVVEGAGDCKNVKKFWLFSASYQDKVQIIYFGSGILSQGGSGRTEEGINSKQVLF